MFIAPMALSSFPADQQPSNCIACHTATNTDVASMNVKPYCVDCHRNVAHMRHKPISTRIVAYE